jgi:MoxR-like ATPase
VHESGNGRTPDLAGQRAELGTKVVGRDRELDLILAAVVAGRDLLLEGPPGTSKSTILRAITASWGIPLHFVEGNAELTPAKLVGHHNPARVLKEDYSADNFVPGPLVAAMSEGGFLYVEELNRAPDDTLNTLLTAMAEREVNVPRVGRIHASPSFRLVASMNPFDNVGTTRISTSVYDRLCRLAVGYQSEAEDREIVSLRTASGSDEAAERLVADAVAITRAPACAGPSTWSRSPDHSPRSAARPGTPRTGTARWCWTPRCSPSPGGSPSTRRRRSLPSRSSGSCGRTTSYSTPTEPPQVRSP